MATSDLAPAPPARLAHLTDAALTVLPVDLDGDQWPRTRLTLRLDEPLAPYLVAELQLEELWQVVDNVKVGMSGRAFLVDDTGRIIADGRPDGKKRIARGEGIGGHPLARATTVADARYTRAYDGVEVLAVSTGAARTIRLARHRRAADRRTRSHPPRGSNGSCCCS